MGHSSVKDNEKADTNTRVMVNLTDLKPFIPSYSYGTDERDIAI